MSRVAVQLPLAAGNSSLPFDPHELSKLLAFERADVYHQSGLDRMQIAAAEQAVHAVLAGEYRFDRPAGGGGG